MYKRRPVHFSHSDPKDADVEDAELGSPRAKASDKSLLLTQFGEVAEE